MQANRGIEQVERLGCSLLLLACIHAWGQTDPDTLRVGGDSNYPPFEWETPDGEVRGFNVELVGLLAAPLGADPEIRLDRWPDTLAALDAGEIDVVAMFESAERRRRYRFTNVYYYQTHALFGRPDRPALDGVGGLAGRDLVVEARSFAHARLADLGPDGELRLSGSTHEALRLVADGAVDYALLAAPVARELIRINGWDVERKSPPFWPRGYAFAVRRDREELAEWLQKRLVEVVSNGQFLALYGQWSNRLEPGLDNTPGAARMALWISGGLLALLLMVATWNHSLRRRVAERTQLLAEELDHRKRAEREARSLARRDPITRLANIRYFCSRCERMLAQSVETRSRTEIMLIRLLEVETVVRSFGYRIAERMIVGFSRALEATFEPPVAHLGRGTFAVVDPRGRAHQRLDALERAVRRGDAPVHPRFVAGSAFYPDDDGDGDVNELLHRAELALAESESRLCRWTRYADHLQSDPVDLEVVESGRADRFDGLDFFLQPQQCLARRRLIGGELLARWVHPKLGPIEPGRFVPVLERAGLIGGLTERAVDVALDSLDWLGRAGVPASVSVNVSARDLADAGFAGRVIGLLEHRCPAEHSLKVEITETSLVGDPENARLTLDTLAEAGVVISLDDFGRGYSSLDYVSRFPIREVKLDRTFTSRLTDSARVVSIVRSTIELAHEMGISVVGEGAESPDQIDWLADLGCDVAQGWAVGRPEARREWLDRIASQHTAVNDRNS